MICKKCNGKGYIYTNAFGTKGILRCDVCGGNGKILSNQQTNEKWFCGLSTEEKAKTIVCLEVNALHKWKKGLVKSDVDEIKRWLKEIHNDKQ